MDELFEKMRDLISSKLDIEKDKITMYMEYLNKFEFETVRDAYNFIKSQKE